MKLELADSLHHQALEIQREHFGVDGPESSVSLMRIGVIHYYQRNYDLASEYLSRAVQADPQNAGAYSNFSTVKLYQWFGTQNPDHLEQSRTYAKRSIEIDNSVPNYVNNLANTYFLADDWNSARVLYERAYAMDENYRRPLNNLAVLSYYQNDLEAAVFYYRKIIETQDNLDNWSYLASSLQLLDDSLDAAIAAHKKTVEKAIEKIEIVTGIEELSARAKKAIAHASLGEQQFALSEINILLQADNQNSDLLHDIGYTYFLLNDLQNAYLYFFESHRRWVSQVIF